MKKFLLVLGALVIAGAVTYYPWTYLDELPGDAGYVYFLTSLIWAPAMLILGLVAGFVFAFVLWPRKPKADPPPPADSTTFEA